jgi:hypothetical protein
MPALPPIVRRRLAQRADFLIPRCFVCRAVPFVPQLYIECYDAMLIPARMAAVEKELGPLAAPCRGRRERAVGGASGGRAGGGGGGGGGVQGLAAGPSQRISLPSGGEAGSRWGGSRGARVGLAALCGASWQKAGGTTRGWSRGLEPAACAEGGCSPHEPA